MNRPLTLENSLVGDLTLFWKPGFGLLSRCPSFISFAIRRSENEARFRDILAGLMSYSSEHVDHTRDLVDDVWGSSSQLPCGRVLFDTFLMACQLPDHPPRTMHLAAL